jgi:hypothetical protein
MDRHKEAGNRMIYCLQVRKLFFFLPWAHRYCIDTGMLMKVPVLHLTAGASTVENMGSMLILVYTALSHTSGGSK